jgi:cytochrome P450
MQQLTVTGPMPTLTPLEVEKGSGLRTPPPVPPGGLFGLRHIRPVKTNFLEYALRLKEQYGDVVRFQIGPIPVFILSHPDHFREALVERTDDLRKPQVFVRAMRPLLRGAIGIASGPDWAHRRKLVHSALAHMDMDRVAAAAALHARRLVLPHEGGELKLTDALERLLLFASVDATLGPGFHDRLDEINELTCMALDSLAGQINGNMPLFVPTPRRRRITRAAARFAELTEESRRACLARGADREECLMAGLLAAEGEGRPGTPREVCEEAAMLFVGGKETAGPVAVWTAYLLARHPEIQQRAAEEVEQVVGDREITAADATRLRWLNAAYNEALRLYPPAMMCVREATRTTVLADCRVPRRSMICLFVYAAQRDPRWWDAPDEFQPARFLDPPARDFSHAYLPFGLGKRSCPGGRVATLETIAALATVLREHRLEWDPAFADPTPLIHMGLRPPPDLVVRLERRRSAWPAR